MQRAADGRSNSILNVEQKTNNKIHHYQAQQ